LSASHSQSKDILRVAPGLFCLEFVYIVQPTN